MDDDELVVRATLEDHMTRGLEKLQAEIKQVTMAVVAANASQVAAIERNTKALDGQHKALSKIAAFRRDMDSLGASIGRMAQPIDTVTRAGLSMARMWTVSVGGAVAGASAAIAGFGVKSAATLENLRLSFDALTGSQQKGAALFQDVSDLAKITPFSIQQQGQSVQMLMNYGITDPTKLMALEKGISDVTSATANPQQNLELISRALGQVYSTGRLQGDEFNQLTNAGVPINQIVSQAYGVAPGDIKKKMQNGESFDAQTLINAFSEMNVPALANLKGYSEKASKTLSGTYSTFQANLQEASAREMAPTADVIKKELPGFGENLAKSMGIAAPGVASLTSSLIQLADHALPVLAPLLNTGANAMSKFVDGFIPWLDREAETGRINDALAKMGPILGEISPILGPLAGDVAETSTNLMALGLQSLPIVVPALELFLDILNGIAQSGPLGTAAITGLTTAFIFFRTAAPIVGGIQAIAFALDRLTASSAAANAATGGPGGFGGLKNMSKGAKIAGGVGGAALGGLGLYSGLTADKVDGMSAVNTIGGGAALGATIGSVIPGVGTLVGAGVGGVAGTVAFGTKAFLGRNNQAAPQGLMESKTMPGVYIHVENMNSDVDLENGVKNGITQYQRDNMERS